MPYRAYDDHRFSKVKAFFWGLLVIILIVGGWLIYHFFFQSVGPANIPILAPPTKSSPSSITYTDKAHVYQVTYPIAWTATPDSADNLAITVPTVDPIELTFTPPDASDSGFGAVGQFELIAFQTDNPLQILTEAKTGTSTSTPKSLTINGYQAYTQDSVNSSAPTFTDVDYVLYHNGVSIYMTIREYQGSSSVVQGYDASSYMPSFMSIMNSIKFLN